MSATMGMTVEAVRAALEAARAKAQSAGVVGADVDAVASVLATLELLNNGASTPLAIASDHNSLVLPHTFAEWAAGFRLANHYDRFLAVAVYKFENSQITTLDAEDVAEMYRKARWDRPVNPADVFAKAAKRLFFTEADDESGGENGKKRWSLTRSGYDHFKSLRVEKENERAD